jgi:hypothetical protein
VKSGLALALVLPILAVPLVAQDQGITSERHRANVGRIVWAKERIAFSAQDRITPVREFTSADLLYGRAYLPKSLVRLGREDNGGRCQNSTSIYRMKVLIDGNPAGILNEQSFESEEWTTVQITPNPASGDEDRQNDGVPGRWQSMINAVPDGTHQVQVELWGGPATCEIKYAEGGFTLRKSGAVQDAAGTLPEARMRNPALEQSMLAAVRRQGDGDEVPVRVVIIEPEWRMIRDGFNNITHREINTHVVLRKVADRTCRANDISFRQPHQGNNRFGATQFYGLGMRSYVVRCPGP